MAYVSQYSGDAPSREDVDRMEGPVVLEFGTGWCGHCQAAQPSIAEALEAHPDIPHLKIEDGKGRRLGRSFSVKLWPTLIFMRDGQEVGRVVRPSGRRPIEDGLRQILGDSPG